MLLILLRILSFMIITEDEYMAISSKDNIWKFLYARRITFEITEY